MNRTCMKGFLAGVLTCALVLGVVGTATATTGKRTVDIDYSDIKIDLNGARIVPTDVNGNAVEPFAINGTTYLPVRAVSNALGLDVDWDGGTHTVKLNGDVVGSETEKMLRGQLLEVLDVYVKISVIAQDGQTLCDMDMGEVENKLTEGTGDLRQLKDKTENIADYKNQVEHLKKLVSRLEKDSLIAKRLVSANKYLNTLGTALDDLENAHQNAIDFLVYGLENTDAFYGFTDSYLKAHGAFSDVKYGSRLAYNEVYPDAFNATYGFPERVK